MIKRSTPLTLFDLKKLIILTILGSYDDKAMSSLIELRDCLRSKGYGKCRLVCDYPFPRKNRKETNEQYFYRKSIFWLEHSDACVFVFLDGVQNDGVAFELQHACDHLEGKLDTCLVAIDSKAKRYATSLLRGKIANLVAGQKINQRFFKNLPQLCSFSDSACYSFLRKRRYMIIDRISV